MDRDRWRRLEDLFHAAAPLATDARATFLRHACPDDPALIAEVERLLDASEVAEPFLSGITRPPDPP